VTVLEVSAGVRSLRWSRDGKYLAADQDRHPGRVTVWEVADWSVAKVINTPRRTHSIALSPDGEFLAAGQIGGTVHVYRVEGGELVAVAPPKDGANRGGADLPRGISFGPDGHLLATGYLAKAARVWKVDL
jgi:WD40 repeat protein